MRAGDELATCTWALRLVTGAYVVDPTSKEITYSIGCAYVWLSAARAQDFATANGWAGSGVPQRARP